MPDVRQGVGDRHVNGSFRDSSCTGKIRFPSKHQAKKGWREMEKWHGRPMWMDVYRCVYCGSFHLGNRRPDLGFVEEVWE